ncbi:MAG: hypothetical protein CUN53_07985 [Phototrophicales bacterium]|nr:MAG: hypothetical protein CUN53_07985 [Phototrophicales bacterium]
MSILVVEFKSMAEIHVPAPKYVLSNPDSEINGLALMALEQSSELEEFTDLLDKYGLRGIEGGRYYKMTTVMDYYREVMQRPNASTNFVSMGINVYKNVVLPEGVTTIEQGLGLLSQMISMNVTNEPGVGTWFEFEKVEDRHIRFIERTPFPHDLLYGYIFGTARRLAPEGTRPIVQRTYLNEADPNADGAIYDITW